MLREGESTEDFMKRMEDEHEKESNIFCPYCNQKQSEETMYSHVSYWGEDSEKECSCEECGKDFMVTECVKRTFETKEQSPVK